MSIRLQTYGESRQIRVAKAWVARPDFTFLSTPGKEDRCRGHHYVGAVEIPSGLIAISDTFHKEFVFGEKDKILTVETGEGDGYYPVIVLKDSQSGSASSLVPRNPAC